MSTHPSQNVRLALIAVLLIVLTAATTAAAGAQTGGAAGNPPVSPAGGLPVPGGPFFVPITSFEFKPYFTSSSYAYSGACLTNTGASSEPFMAPVRVPNGVYFTKVVVYYVDQDEANDVWVNLQQAPLYGSAGLLLASFNSTGSKPGPVYGATTDIPAYQADLSTSAYLVEVTLPASSNVMLCGVRIDYGYAFQANVPLVRKQ